jgi:ATP dependent DNA ligase-like protein
MKLNCRSAILDGEAVVQDGNGASDFEALGSALRQRPHSIILYGFDLLHLDGKDLRQQTLIERRARLKGLLGTDERSRIQFSDEFDGDGAAKPALSRDLRASSPNIYRSGRSKTWLKTKCFTESTFVVIGTDRDRKTGALRALLAHNDGTGLNYAGAAFIALAGEERAQFLGELERLATSWAALKSSRMHDVDRGGGEASGGKQDAPSRSGERIRVMTVYIRPNGDDENDGTPVKSPKRAIAIANRNNDQEINLLTTDWARIIASLGAPRRVSSHRAVDRPWITPPCRSKTLRMRL